MAIAGGGLLGRLLAWQLLEHGHQVSVYEAGSLVESPSAAKTAAGMISPISEAIDTELLMYDLGMVALQQWPKWLQQLLQAMPDQPVYYSHQGSVIVAHQRDQSLLHQYRQDIQRQLLECAQGHWLDGTTIAEMEPDLEAYFRQGLYFPDEAHIDNRHLLQVLLTRIQQLGGECIEHTPVDTDVFTIRERLSYTDQHFDSVIDCRGVGAKPQWRNIRGVRGEILRVKTDEVMLRRPVRLLHPRYQLYIVPKPNSEFVIGATQIESEDCSPMSVQSALELNSALYAINSAFAEARILEMDVNLRPALNHNRPNIQCQPGLLRINGLYRHGYLVAPVVVQHTLALLLDSITLKHDFSEILFDGGESGQLIEETQSAYAIDER
ncbi:glycine oxidase ThiO [Candidatus Endobugula sertula]|uniref:D-amino-acid oxidase n=1 Tax=Candidatus Endobugula sertula TaxID=62101 RepID=A0A1D2QNV2_9GAMM|nr:glycine oxidase ThiO [Candidatus Endobugula sertula]